MTTATHSVDVTEIGPVEVSVTEYGPGSGQPFLLLHGGAGPQSVTGFAEKFAALHQVRVLAPTHPGFAGTARPGALDSVGGLAALYQGLLDTLDLTDVTVIGNSIGGWITAEIALLASPRVSGIVLIDAVGIEVPGHPVVDFFTLTFPEIAQRSYYEPAKFLIDPSTMTPQQQAGLAGNRTALSAYAGETSMMDPTLRKRLSTVELPIRVIWGDHDRIADPDYGRAYADAIPNAEFVLLTETGHMPQLETPKRLVPAVWDFADAHHRPPR
jgi:pimeloyl-ACP methyl ester carboxylesterase